MTAVASGRTAARSRSTSSSGTSAPRSASSAVQSRSSCQSPSRAPGSAQAAAIVIACPLCSTTAARTDASARTQRTCSMEEVG